MSKSVVILGIGDVHLADTTPASRMDDYCDSVFEDLSLARQKALDEEADAVVVTGDIFDKKVPTKNSHALVSRAISMFSSFPCPVYSIVGNHDITNNRMDSLSKQPLNVLFESGALKRLTRVSIKGVDVVGIDFNEENTYETLCPKKKNGKPLIAVCHVLASPHGGDMYGETIFSYKQLAEQSDVDVYKFGHFHNDQGIEKYKGKWFVNLGALSRGSLSEEEITRQVKISKIVWDGEKIECSEIPLPVKLASEIFNIEKKEEIDKQKQEIKNFVSTLNKTDLFQDISSLEETVKDMKLETGVKNRLSNYLNNRGAEINL